MTGCFLRFNLDPHAGIMVRLYRIFGAFEYLNRKMMIGQVALTLLRTTTVLFYVVGACPIWQEFALKGRYLPSSRF
eukprot:1153263-Pelagomonas_calceolata.AAC.3